MYYVHNITNGETFPCDAVETIVFRNGKYHPAERDAADGFNALIIRKRRNNSEYYDSIPFVYEGHTLAGTEDVGTFEWVDDEETDIPIVPPEQEDEQGNG